MGDVILDTILDSVKLLPFLFLTYLIMEYMEHKTSRKTIGLIKKSERFGPIIGGLLGAIPQCGFSVSATNFYAGKIITLGTLIAIYLSTSDEMLPILISNNVGASVIIKILSIKILIGIIAGLVIDFIIKLVGKGQNKDKSGIESICEHEHCHCDDGIVKSTLKHTASIFIFILIICFALNTTIYFIGEEALAGTAQSSGILSQIIICLIGLIPNCASSVIITELYVSNVITMGTLIGGLLANSGLGLIVLLRVNRNMKENILVIGILYTIALLTAIIL